MPEFTQDTYVYVGETYVDIGEVERETTMHIDVNWFVEACNESERKELQGELGCEFVEEFAQALYNENEYADFVSEVLLPKLTNDDIARVVSQINIFIEDNEIELPDTVELPPVTFTTVQPNASVEHTAQHMPTPSLLDFTYTLIRLSNEEFAALPIDMRNALAEKLDKTPVPTVAKLPAPQPLINPVLKQIIDGLDKDNVNDEILNEMRLLASA